MTENIKSSGMMPALKTLSFSRIEKLRSSFGRIGPIFGLRRQRIRMYARNRTVINNPGPMPASHSWLTGWRAIIPYNTSTMLGGMRMPSELPA